MKKLFLVIAAVAASFCVSAQTFETGFFLDNYSYAHRTNAAFSSEKNVLGFGIGNISLESTGNVGVGNFFFPFEGQIVNGLDKRITSEQFLSGLKKNNVVSEDVTWNLFTLGVWNKQRTAYNTFEINFREYGSAGVPKDMFAFLKNGGLHTYNLSNLNVDAKTYIDIAYGRTMNFGDKVKFGFRAKLLVGLASARLAADDFTVESSLERLSISSTASLQVAQQALKIKSRDDGTINLNSLSIGTPSLAGFGAGIDLGVSYEPIDGLVTSLAVNDLGFVSWKYDLNAQSVGSTIVAISQDMKIEDLVKSLFHLKQKEKISAAEMIPFVINAGARYAMPFYKNLSAGLLLTYRNYKNGSSFCGRLGATITPVKWFSFCADYGIGTFGSNIGTALSLNLGPFNLFAGVETYLGGTMADIPLPLATYDLCGNAGITIRFK